jgi:hypothetical protein
MICKLCFEDIVNIVQYDNKQFDYCIDCLNYLLKNQWYDYIHKIKTMDCEKSLKNLINGKIPTHFRDVMINDNQEIKEFIFHNEIISGKLNASLSINDIDILNDKLQLCLNEHDYITAIKNLIANINK